MNKRLLIIGGVAGGATAAARARRYDETAEIVVLERGPYVSYANCGLPYFISGDIDSREALLLQTPEGFQSRYRVTTHVNTEALAIDRTARRVRARGPDGEKWYPYDRLILAQGGNPISPTFAGATAPHVFKLWTVPDMDRIHDYIETHRPRTAVVVGGGFIGLEMAEAFHQRGIATTVVELMPQLLSVMDGEFGRMVQQELEGNGLGVCTGVAVTEIGSGDVLLSDGVRLPAELVLFSVGVRPELTLAKEAGLDIGSTGALLVNKRLETSDSMIYAVGDMIEVTHKVAGRKVRVPLAGPANRQGRIAASNALGAEMRYNGTIGTSIVKVFDKTAAMTGLSERAARDAGFSVGVAAISKPHHATYYPGATDIALKVVYDRSNAQLLGAQAFGDAGVDKRIDVLATALQGKLTLHDLAELDLAYAPPYSSANDPVNVAAFVGLNDISGYSRTVTATELIEALLSDRPPWVLDVRSRAEFEFMHVPTAHNVPVDELRAELATLPKAREIVVYCRSGYRGHLALRILHAHGFDSVTNVTGGFLSLESEPGFSRLDAAHR